MQTTIPFGTAPNGTPVPLFLLSNQTGAVVGALIMGVLNNGMSLLGWSVDVQRVVKGLVLLAAVAIDLHFKSKKNS